MSSNTKNITVVGGGIAGMQVAFQLSMLGFSITLLEKQPKLGGRIAALANIFPQNEKGAELTQRMVELIKMGAVTLQLFTEYQNYVLRENGLDVITNRGVLENQQAVIMANGFKLYDPTEKEELGYGIFKNVITASELESILTNNELKRYIGANALPDIAFVHCVGSRDRQIERNHCSKICCMVGVKQAVEMKKRFPGGRVTNFYMDLRMYDEGFEELYYEAQACHKINFVRGRVSEISENLDNKLLVRAEDTLLRKPLSGQFDLVVLLNGYEPAVKEEIAPIFYTKSSRTTTTINEAIAEANSLALEVANYFKLGLKLSDDRVWICN